MLIMMLIMGMPVIVLCLFWLMPVKIAVPLYVAGVAVSLVYHRAMMASRKLPRSSGPAGMIGERGTVLAWRLDGGTVRCRAEIWTARCEPAESLPPGTDVEILRVEGLALVVRPSHRHAEADGSDPGRSGRRRLPTSRGAAGDDSTGLIEADSRRRKDQPEQDG
jgi:membrane protein implicated in regulation of membrane protease activity